MLTGDDVLRGLRQLAERLDNDGVEVVIFLVGGAAMVLTVRPDRQLTNDIDSWVNDHGNDALRQTVFAAVADVGRLNPGFPDDWLNDKAKGFIPDRVSGDTSEWVPVLNVGGVQIFAARPEVLLAMKLLAGRGARDLPDLPSLVEACRVSTVNEAMLIFDGFYPHDEPKPAARRWLQANLL